MHSRPDTCADMSGGIISERPKYGTEKGLQTPPFKLATEMSIPTTCWLILVVELAERLVFYTLNGTQEFFLESIGVPLSQAAGLNATMVTLSALWALPASWVADVKLGRSKTILGAGVFYIVGVVMAACAAMPGAENRTLYLVGTLGVLPVATAGIKANISNMGAEQYDNTPGGKIGQEKFFSVFYLFINIGAAFAYGFFTTFAASASSKGAYGITYGMMAFFMFIAIVIYSSGLSEYHVRPVQMSSALGRTTRAILHQVRTGSIHAMAFSGGFLMLFICIVISVAASLSANLKGGVGLYYVEGVCFVLGVLFVVVACRNTEWLYCRPHNEALEVNTEDPFLLEAQVSGELQDLQKFLGLLPVLLVGTLAFNAVYNSMGFWFQQQACQMDVRFPIYGRVIMLSGSFFNVADCMAIVIMTPIVVNYINPAIERVTGRSVCTRTKFSIGMGLGILSVSIAALLELHRREAAVLPHESHCSPTGVNMSDISAHWMSVPYFLAGMSEIYCVVTLMHYCFAECPPDMRTLSTAVFFFVQAVSTSMFTLETLALQHHIPNNLNHGHLEYGYYLNLWVAVVLYGVFMLLAK